MTPRGHSPRGNYESGRFLLTRLGAERYLDPEQVATLLHLRRRIIAEVNLAAAVEFMLLDTGSGSRRSSSQ